MAPRSRSRLFSPAVASHRLRLSDAEAHRHASKTITTVTQAEGRRAHTDHRQWAVTAEEGVADALPRREEDGEEEAEGEGEEDAEAAISDTGRARTRDLGAGRRAEACLAPRTVGRLRRHRRAEEVAGVDLAGETRRRDEEEEAVVGGGAQAMMRTIARGPEAGAESAGSFRLSSRLYSSVR